MASKINYPGQNFQGGGGSGGGLPNLLTKDPTYLDTFTDNQSFESTIGTWVAYSDAAGTQPVDMTGGSPNTTIARSISSPLDGAGSALMTVNSGASRQGEGVSTLVYVPPAFRGKNVQFNFPFETTGTLVEDDFKAYAYIIDGAAAGVVTPFWQSKIIGAQGVCQSVFAIPTDCTQLRIGIHIARTSTGAATIKFDDVYLTNVIVPIGLAGSDIKDFPGLTFTGLGTVSNTNAWISRMGDTAEIFGYTTTGTPDGTAFSVILPSGYSIDSLKQATVAKTECGMIYDVENNVANTFPAIGYGPHPIFYDGSTTDRVFAAKNTNTGSIFNKDSGTNLFASGITATFRFKIPIAGWSSNVQMANSAQFNISSYLANGTRVTGTAPTKLGEYRSYLRNAGANTWTETNGNPTTAPSSDGFVIYNGNSYASADTNNQPTRYEIFVGKNKNVSFKYFSSTGKTGFANTSPLNYTEFAASGIRSNYDPTTGIATLFAHYGTGSETSHVVGINGSGNALSLVYVDIVISENALSVGVDPVRSSVRVRGGNGQGSTATKIRRFTTLVESVGSAITYADSATDGGSFTINEDGVYSIFYTDISSSAGNLGVSKNASSLTTNIDSLANAEALSITRANTADVSFTMGGAFPLRAGDVIRAHKGSGNTEDTYGYSPIFTITKVSN
jgi:hypothetical protein